MDVKTQSDAEFDTPAVLTDNSGRQSAQDGGWTSFVLFLLKLVLAVLVLRSFIISPFSIPSESMLPRLWNGDYLLAAKWPYGYSSYSLPFSAPLIPERVLASEPDRGDLVIFKHPVDKQDYVKRVIGLPGDTVAVVGGQIVLNGDLVPRNQIADFDVPVSANTACAWGGDEVMSDEDENVCRYRRFREMLPGGREYDVLEFGLRPAADTFAEQLVPDGHMFVMGDNRDASLDSRFEAAAGLGVGMVDQDLLVGEAMILVWSTDGSAEWSKPWTWLSAARWNRIGKSL